MAIIIITTTEEERAAKQEKRKKIRYNLHIWYKKNKKEGKKQKKSKTHALENVSIIIFNLLLYK